MMKKRAEEVAARVAQFKKLPAALRLMYAEKTVDEVVAFLVELAGVVDSLKSEVAKNG